VKDLVGEVLGRSSGRGHPPAEVIRDDGSSVTLGTDGERAVLIWVDALGDSYHTVGDGGSSLLIFDSFGSWSETPSDWQVPLAQAIDAMEQFVQYGTPATERVIFQPD
jgi:glutamine synthetase type III